MSYRFKASESISQGIKRIAQEQVAKAITELSNPDTLGVDEAVHQARKRLKKTRAVLRLVRDRLGQTYKAENARFRDLGRSLAKLRDEKVLIDTLDHLTAHFAKTISSDTFTDLRRELRVDYRQEYQRVLNENTVILVKNKLKDAYQEIDDWIIDSDNWSAIDSSLKRVYKRGYQGLRRAISEPSAENFHEWRKRVKYLRYQLRIIQPIWSKILEEWIAQTHDLSDLLGDEHDLAVLQKYCLSQPKRFKDSQNTLETLTALSQQRRAELQSAAIFLGKRIYTEKPQDFVERFGNYWQIWQAEV